VRPANRPHWRPACSTCSTRPTVETAVGMTPEERARVFAGLERTMEAILADAPPEDRCRIAAGKVGPHAALLLP